MEYWIFKNEDQTQFNEGKADQRRFKQKNTFKEKGTDEDKFEDLMDRVRDSAKFKSYVRDDMVRESNDYGNLNNESNTTDLDDPQDVVLNKINKTDNDNKLNKIDTVQIQCNPEQYFRYSRWYSV